MTTKRFIIMDNLPKRTHSNIWDKQKQHNQGIGDELWLGEVVAMLNEGVILAEENEQLKQVYTQLKHRHSLLHDECIDAECDRDRYRKDIASLEKENEQLKQEIETLHEENQKLKKLNIPIDEIKDTVSDYRGRIIGVYYND